jgi:tRNA G18 (ribose-2'-O)-methylase SpoU
VVAFCREHSIAIIAASPESPRLEDSERAVKAHTEIDLSRPVALVLGREGSGIPEETASTVDEEVYIPMADGVESLNVAAAAAVLLYEAARQRCFTFGKGKSRGRKKE